jgi:hypothetical protein
MGPTAPVPIGRALGKGRFEVRAPGPDRATPFATPKGEPYLKVHRLRRLCNGGPDDSAQVAVLCPNCHHASDPESFEEEVRQRPRCRETTMVDLES